MVHIDSSGLQYMYFLVKLYSWAKSWNMHRRTQIFLTLSCLHSHLSFSRPPNPNPSWRCCGVPILCWAAESDQRRSLSYWVKFHYITIGAEEQTVAYEGILLKPLHTAACCKASGPWGPVETCAEGRSSAAPLPSSLCSNGDKAL